MMIFIIVTDAVSTSAAHDRLPSESEVLILWIEIPDIRPQN